MKTAAGWRFKSRVHVFPNLRESVQFGPRGRGVQPPRRRRPRDDERAGPCPHGGRADRPPRVAADVVH